MTSSLRRAAVLATVLAAGTYAALGGAGFAGASFPGTSGLLTSSNYNTIYGANLHPQWCDENGCVDLQAGAAAWSPDGSRAVFINQFHEVQTVRYDDEYDTWWVADAVDNGQGTGTPVQRNDPTYVGTGDTIIWTETDYHGSPYRLMMSSSTYGWEPVRFSPEDSFNYVNADSGPSGMVVFERWVTGVGANEVWLWDGNEFSKIIDGRDPSLSPDGTKIAYVCSGSWICTANLDGSGSQQVGDVTGSNPVWSPDGATIAFNYSASVMKVPAAGGTVTPASLTGKAAWRPDRKDGLARLAGTNRYGTATAVAQAYWKTAADNADPRPAAQAVVLSRSDTFADALGGSALATAKQGPLLLTSPTSLNSGTSAEIQRVLGGNASATVYLLGGTGAISIAVENAVTALGYQVKRLSGSNRFATAIAIANEIDPDPAYVLAATGMNFPDALSAGAAAGNFNRPGFSDRAVVVLTNDATLPTATKDYLDAHGAAMLFPIGRQAVEATAAHEDPADDTDGWGIWGDNRYETAMYVADAFFDAPGYAGVATGTNWPDALAGGALLGTLGSPLMLTPGTASQLNPATAFKLSIESASMSTLIVFGGSSVVSNAVAGQAATWISGPAGFTSGTSLPIGILAQSTSGTGARTLVTRPGVPTTREPLVVPRRVDRHWAG